MSDSLQPSSDNDEESSEVNLELIKQFLEVQKNELAVRSEEIQSSDRQSDRNFELAKMQIQEVARDRRDNRQNSQKILITVLIFAFTIILILSVFLGYAMSLDKDEIALEIIKAIAFFGAGAFGGYSFGKNQGRNDISDSSDE